MTHLYPENPAKVNIHLLPSNADFISYRISDGCLKLKAWMPGDIASFTLNSSESQEHNRFYANHCSNCERNTYSFYQNFENEHGCVDWDQLRADGDCIVYWGGYRGQTCHKGFIFESPKNDVVSISNCVIEISLDYLSSDKRYQVINECDNAHLSAGKFDDQNNHVWRTEPRRASNVFSGESDYDGYICWGQAKKPTNLREAAIVFLTSRPNNDLLNLSAFKENIDRCNNNKKQEEYQLSPTDNFLCSGYEALMIVDAQKNVQAFFTLLMAGFRPMEEIPHAIIIPIEQSSITRGDQLFFGYTTPEDSTGRKWYITSEGFLIGQLNESFSCSRHR